MDLNWEFGFLFSLVSILASRKLFTLVFNAFAIWSYLHYVMFRVVSLCWVHLDVRRLSVFKFTARVLLKLVNSTRRCGMLLYFDLECEDEEFNCAFHVKINIKCHEHHVNHWKYVSFYFLRSLLSN